MKRITVICMLIISVILAGCAQTGKNASSDRQPAKAGEASAKPEAKKEDQPAPKSDFPNRPIEIIVPFAPGGSTDVIARIMANAVSKNLPNGQSVVVVNKPGGAATIGMSELVGAKPDGYKLAITSIDAISIQPHYGKVSYTPDSFQPVMKVAFVPLMLLVNKDAPWKNFEEWLDYVKKNPGKFSYGSATGTGGIGHLAVEALNDAAGVQTKHIPFDGRGPAVTALMGGHVQGAIALLNPGEKDTLRALVNFAGTKSEAYQDVPLLKEKGIDVAVGVDTGIIAPKGLPKEVLDILHNAFKKTLEDPEVLAQIKKLNVDPSYAGPDDFKKLIADSYQSNGQLLKKIGLVK